MKITIRFFLFLFVCFSEALFSQTIKWTSEPYQTNNSFEVGWVKVNDNPIEFRYYQWESYIGRFMMMDGAMSNTILFELKFDYDYHAFFKNDVYNYTNSKLDYDGDGLYDLVFTHYGEIIIISVSTGAVLFELGDNQHSYSISKIFDIDGDGMMEIAIQRTTYSDWAHVTQIYATNGAATVAPMNEPELPNDYALKQNYPNPFNPSTTIEYEISKPAKVKINIYDVTGRLVKELVHEQRNTGKYSTVWNGKDNSGKIVSSGKYFYQIISGDFVQAKKMILLK